MSGNNTENEGFCGKEAAERIGYEVGDVCGRSGCAGVIAEAPREGCCSCHISPPCASCTEPREYCPECDWQAKDDEEPINDYLVRPNHRAEWGKWRPRPLDPTKIDYRTHPHTHFTQICEGVCPTGTTQREVEEKVRGTFGGRFERWTGSTFRYVAYTD